MHSPSPSHSADDGREHFGRNVAFAWGGYMVNVISGFVMPRLISDQLGQVTLGVWDFAWSFVSYFGLVQMGMGGSISRYVAHYRAKNDIAGLNRSVSTIAIFQRAVGWLALVLAIVSAVWLVPLFGERLGPSMNTARWVLLILGVEIALTISLAVYKSVIGGCHRWALHNTIIAVAYGLASTGMVCALLLGGGLTALAMMHCTIMVGAEVFQWKIIKHVCPELVIERQLASWSSFREQLQYSSKSIIPRIANLTSNQALSLLITAYLGPASLAIFSRPRSLVFTFRALAAKFGTMLVSTSSSLQARGDHAGLRQVLLSAPAMLSSLMLPPLVTIAVLGDIVICFWMGPHYVQPGLVPVLAVGTYAAVVQEPVWGMLSGMNVHGRLAILRLLAAIVSAGLLAVGLGLLNWGLLGAAISFTLPQLLVDGISGSVIACRNVEAPLWLYLRRTFIKPLACIFPYGLGLWIGLELQSAMLPAAIAVTLLGTCITWLLYWYFILSVDAKRRCIICLQCLAVSRKPSSVV